MSSYFYFRWSLCGWHPTINLSSLRAGMINYSCMLSILICSGERAFTQFSLLFNQVSTGIVLLFCTYTTTNHYGLIWCPVGNWNHVNGYVRSNPGYIMPFKSRFIHHYGVGVGAYCYAIGVTNTNFCIGIVKVTSAAVLMTRISSTLVAVLQIMALMQLFLWVAQIGGYAWIAIQVNWHIRPAKLIII